MSEGSAAQINFGAARVAPTGGTTHEPSGVGHPQRVISLLPEGVVVPDGKARSGLRRSQLYRCLETDSTIEVPSRPYNPLSFPLLTAKDQSLRAEISSFVSDN